MASSKYAPEQVERLMREFESGTKTRAEFCRQRGIPVTTLDYWRRRRKPRLLEVAVETPVASGGFSLVLGNGRRIECGAAELAGLIRIAESL